MKLKKIEIKNYRQFRHSKINLEEGITVLAGANNSGKTSLINLLKNILSNQVCRLSIDDLPVKYAKKLAGHMFNLVSELISKEKDLTIFINEIVELTNNIEKFNKGIGIFTNLEVSYEENENISKFADYLMDLKEDNFSFYFRFEYTYNVTNLVKIIKSKYDMFSNDILEAKELLMDSTEYKTKKERIQKKLLQYFLESFEPYYYFTDETYKNKISMDRGDFLKLFNFHCINANKRLTDDATNSDFSISKEMIDYISNDKEWSNLVKNLPNHFNEIMDNTKIKDEIQEKSLLGLENAIKEISKTSGGNQTKMHLDLEVDEETILNFIKRITKTQYLMGDFVLNEYAQGLGYSNLILIHLRLEKFIQGIDNSIINIFIIEEPEVHMHPQMQKVFIEYLYKYYKDEKIQGLITTHSQEIVKVSKMTRIRVIRQKSFLVNKVFDLRVFTEKIDGGDANIKRFYNLFFNLNLSDLIFADCAILYEGDTERMYIKALIANTDEVPEVGNIFKFLTNLYIAFVQVGGAHAHIYTKIIDFLQIKTVIFTDVDYEKQYVKKEDILTAEVKNPTIKQFYEKKNEGISNFTVKELLEWEKSHEFKLINLKFQGSEDAYGRTLEESMLANILDKEISFEQNSEAWKQIRRDKEIEFSIPQKDTPINIRDIVNSTGNSKKTDFMYSVIHTRKCFDMLPNYIKEGLMWLKEEN